VETQWDLLRPLGISPPDPETDPTEMADDPVASASVNRRLRDAHVNGDAPLVVVHVSAGNPFRRWPADSFVDLICRLAASDPRRRIVLTSGPSDAVAATDVAKRARARLTAVEREAVLQVGEFDLAELRALIGSASLYIGGDSGPLHVAGTTRVPVVGLYGPTLPVRSQAWRNPSSITEAAEVGQLPCRPCDQRQCTPGDFRCLTGISAEAVAQLAERALARAAQSAAPKVRPADPS
jgi:ADP-heptose:LPS heptosyltransferase